MNENKVFEDELKNKETSEEALVLDEHLTEEEKIRKLYDELVSLRDKVKSSNSTEEIRELYERINEVTTLLDELTDNSIKNYGAFEEALATLDKEIFAVEELRDENNREYERLFDEMKEIMAEQRDLIKNSTLPQEEFDKLNNALIDKMNACNDKSLRVKKNIDLQVKDLATLYKKKEGLNSDLTIAKSLGIPAVDFIEITDKFNRRDIIDGTIEAFGLSEIIATNYKNRSVEDKQKLKQARESIYAEVEKVRKLNEVDSILNKIDALYPVDQATEVDGKRRVLLVKPTSLAVINENATNLPEKIVRNNDASHDYVPSSAPKDMEEVLVKIKDEKVAAESTEEKKSVSEEKALAVIPEKVEALAVIPPKVEDLAIRDVDLKKTNQEDVVANTEIPIVNATEQKVEENTTTNESEKVAEENVTTNEPEKVEALAVIPPKVEDLAIRDVDLNKTNQEEVVANTEIPIVNETEQKVEENTTTNESEKVAEEKITTNDFEKVTDENSTTNTVADEVDESDFIPGTNIRRPRGRGIHETDEEYVAYLEEYYNSVFPPKVENDDILRDKIVLYKDEINPNKYYAKGPVFDRFNADKIGDMVRIDGKACYEIDSDTVEYIIGNANNSYSPYIVDVVTKEEIKNKEEEDLSNVVIPQITEEEIVGPLVDKFVIYRDKDKYYAKKPVFYRFNLDAYGDMVRINNIACYEIAKEDVDYIVNNANNDYSPYVVVFEDLDNVRENEQKDNPVDENDDNKDDSLANDGDLLDDLKDDDHTDDNDNVRDVVDTNPLPIIDDNSGDEDQQDDDDKKNVSDEDSRDKDGDDKKPTPTVNPTDKDEKDTPPGPTPIDTEDEVVNRHTPREEIITLYRDISDNNQVYASDDVIRKFGIPVSTTPIEIEGQDCYKISRDTNQIINSIAKMSRDPKIIINYKDISLKKNAVRPHVEEILDKITDGLDIKAKDCKRFTASNMKISKTFKNELSSGNVVYNIVHVVPAIIKAGASFARKLTGKLLTSKRAKESMTTIKERLDDLSDEELEVLFEEYKGSQLKTDMNNQINPLILDRIREYGLSKVAELNEQIRTNYTVLFTILGQVGVLEESLENGSLSQAEVDVLEAQRKQLMGVAAEQIRNIISSRNKANNLLSSGVHGIEEDFKAVATKLNYVGLRFTKTNDFDNELQHRLGNFGRNLNVALSVDNDEAIVQNFMGLESCYYENTDIRGSIVGRRSVGSKYYSPMAEQFDYRDDPFMRDLLTTVAVTSATISAINAARVHQIESKQILEEQKAQADTVNMQNDSTMDYVHQTGADIAGRRDTFRQGMEAQAKQDVLNDANAIERATLDTHNWKFNSSYRAADDAGHELYNQFNIDVTNKINDVTAQYASGSITSAEALERMAQISNDAQATLVETVDTSLQIIRDYASTHPQFDLRAVEESMSYMISHPGAIANMNQSMIDAANLAEGLTSLQAAHMTALTSLPSDMASTIVCAASSALLAMNVANAMNKGYGNKKGYGNEITEMMDEYMYGSLDEDEEELEDSRSK